MVNSTKPKLNINGYLMTKGSGELLPSLGVHKLFTFQASSPKPLGQLEPLSRNVPSMVLYKLNVFRSSRIFNMAAKANNML